MDHACPRDFDAMNSQRKKKIKKMDLVNQIIQAPNSFRMEIFTTNLFVSTV